MDYRRHDRYLFIDLISNIPGVVAMRSESIDGISCSWFMGLAGSAVMIDTTDMEDDIDIQEGEGYLSGLGLKDLTARLFPVIVEPNEEEVADMVEHEYLKDKAIEGLDE